MTDAETRLEEARKQCWLAQELGELPEDVRERVAEAEQELEAALDLIEAQEVPADD